MTLDEGISSAVVPSAGLLDVLENEKYCDVTFVVDGEKFKAHRVILASQCEYFDRYQCHCRAINMTCKMTCRPIWI